MNKHSQRQPFYIGYLPKMPDSIRKFLQPWVILLFLLVPCIAAVIVQAQRGFSTATFELGKSTTLKGALITHPLPMLRVSGITDRVGQAATQDVLLIGFGKSGAQGSISVWEKQAGHPLDGYEVEIKGTLIYHDGKTLLELTEGKQALLTVNKEKKFHKQTGDLKAKGIVELTGEIIDAKCYFGVMKPGYSKPHRSCASLCIAGGIPPVLKTQAADGKTQYVLVMGKGLTLLTSEMKPYVAKAVSLNGKISHRNGWDFIELDDLNQIHSIY